VARDLLIAVIDDDESFRTALVDSLGSFGFGVREFACAEDFVEADGIDSCHCVITDIHMPGMSGIELKRALVSRDYQVPVIMITARAEPGLDAKVAASGAVGLLIKPFESHALMDCLKKVLAA
jgi:FixJ family two-component response regulator